MPGIGVVTNPRSRTNKRDPSRMRKLGYLIGSRGSAAATRSLDDLQRVAEEFRDADIDVLGINGGDGTIHHTLTAFIKAYGDKPLPLIAILRGGTMNTIAASLRIKGDPARLLFELCDRYARGEPFDVFERRCLSVGGDKFGFIFGNGLIFNFLDAYYATGRPSPATAAELLLRAAASATVGGELASRITRRFEARVTVDGQTWAREDFVTVAISTVEELGLGFKPFYRAGDGVDKLPVLGVHAPTPLSIMAELPRVFLGRPLRRDKAIDTLADEVVFETASGTVEYIIDGDTYRSPSPLVVRPGPRLRLIRLTGRATEDEALPSDAPLDDE